MSGLYIDGLSAPDEIKNALKDLSKNYVFTKEVEKGANGYLFFGRNRILGTEVAVKFYYWGGDKEYHAEPKNLAAIESDNILAILDASLIDNDWAYFVTPYCPNGDLDNYIDVTWFGNLAAIDFISAVLSGLSYLHAERFLHRDLKPANIYLNDAKQAVIGDFGSLKVIPEGKDEIPASRHSILYRPPESILHNTFSSRGDIYQVGLVFYQLLGGHLPYDELAWMSKRELKHYNELTGYADRSIYVDQCIKSKITKGKIIDLKTLPPWVPESVKRIIRKSTNVNPGKRYKNATEFKADLHKIRPTVLDWEICGGVTMLNAKTSYRIEFTEKGIQVLKRKTGTWQKDNTIKSDDLSKVVSEIEARV
ncbi:serine/threonine-protein kinase [Oceanobacter sp. 3_MG-2023]|uniref:serine/threonine-protein kinase n=1 Tax=Oceanobacter sp. 3_MG-2023 TaxID=3062622 RepID=UPI0027326DAC|nr:serine/threonine-protein kinase [Oceanobacter sp. 3_MG-2023]MDP2505829.1 serine/threonine-protein kinase [Oceanobacter sp. 3_MG-2023]